MTEDEILDRLLTKYLAVYAAGREADPAPDVAEHPALESKIREVWELARDTSPRRRAPRTVPTFAGYEIERELGAGGMGHVYLARHVKLGRTVALKVLPHRLASSRARERFVREARSVARLEHPLIVPVFDLGEDDGQPYFTMQYVPGRTLATVLASVRSRDPATLTGRDFAGRAGGARSDDLPGPWRESWWHAAVRAAIDVAEALAHAHEAGVVHRDVKPSNVMIRDDASALLFDFGLAAVDDGAEASLTQGFVGTPHYASPEQAAGTAGELDARSDVFSLGATLYEALTLQTPFFGPNPSEILRRIQTWEPEPPSRLNTAIPRAVETVVLAALEKDRDARYATVSEMAQDLRAVLDGATIRAKRAGLITRGLRAVKRNRAVTELLVERQALRSALMRAEKNEQLAREREEEARAARERADAERERAARVLEFLKDTLAAAHPDRDGRDVKVLDLLDRASARATETFRQQPETLLSIRLTLAETFGGLDDPERHGELARLAFESAVRDLPEHAEVRIRAQMEYAAALLDRGRTEHALALFEQAGAAAAALPQTAAELGIRIRQGIAGSLAHLGRTEDSAAALRIALGCSERDLGADHPQTRRLRSALAITERDLGHIERSVTLASEAYQGWHRAGDERHPQAVIAADNYASVLVTAGRPEESLEILDRVRPIAAAALGASHPSVLDMDHTRGGALMTLNRLEEAAEVQRRLIALDAAAGRRDPNRSDTFAAVHVRLLLRLCRWAEAETAARELLRRVDPTEAGILPRTIATMSLSRALYEQGRHTEAEPFGLDAWTIVAGWHEHRLRGFVAATLVGLYDSWGRPEKADEFRPHVTPAK